RSTRACRRRHTARLVGRRGTTASAVRRGARRRRRARRLGFLLAAEVRVQVVARGPGPAASPGPLVFVSDLDRPELDDADRHHLERVLRLRAGDAFVAADGAGGWRACRFGAAVDVDGPVARVARPMPPITVAFAVPKGDRPELAVQKLTEVGVDTII